MKEIVKKERFWNDMDRTLDNVGNGLRGDVVVGTRRIRSEKLREHHHREGYVRSLEGKGVEWDGYNNVEHMWEQVKRAMVGKFKRSMRFSESWGGEEPNECVVERRDKSCR